ncbi:MAG TPA: type II toxin-antitoxin system VapB family antitoxin [Thermodesulfovibrionia bacterium]|nr:type II toxin-antitoxin system VapB family antitoxin [Thermodesulfovibrionia bacterium]
MAIIIRDSIAEQLAMEVAAKSGVNLTEAIISALEEKLESLKNRTEVPDIFQEIMIISKRCSSLPDIDSCTPDEILGYDQKGITE